MCGVVALVHQNQSFAAAAELAEACIFLQHRGQDACGLSTSGIGGRVFQCKGPGMVRDVFTEAHIHELVGNMGIAHLRYPTSGCSARGESQPFYVNSPYGLSISHNGNLVNIDQLEKYLDEDVHRHVNTDSDSELLLNVMAAELATCQKRRVTHEDLFDAMKAVYDKCVGSYACVGMVAGFGVFGFRDPWGIRPLLFGERTNSDGSKDFMVASESVVLKALGFDKFRDINPGEAVFIPREGTTPVFKQIVPVNGLRPDLFEYVYFARPDSILDGISVYRSRLEMGERLAETIKKTMKKSDIDVVVPVPDTARTCALQCANALGVPYREGFVKNRYVGRTFIMPNQKQRLTSVKRKLNPMSSEFEGRNVLIVDDSIVRGTTSREIVNMARESGAKKVYFASAAPPIRYNHIYGIDLADAHDLIAYNRTDDEVAKEIGCDKVFYQTLEDLVKCCQGGKVNKFEEGVFTGNYVTGYEPGYMEHLGKPRTKRESVSEDLNLYNINE